MAVQGPIGVCVTEAGVHVTVCVFPTTGKLSVGLGGSGPAFPSSCPRSSVPACLLGDLTRLVLLLKQRGMGT